VVRVDRPSAVVLVPAKAPQRAKSRLRAELGPSADLLAAAMALDVVEAALAAGEAPVVLVCADPRLREQAQALGAAVHASCSAGLNEDLREAADSVRRAGATALVVVPADCPCTTADDVAALVAAARDSDRWCFLADARGTGTTALAVPAAVPFGPAFGPGSATAHEAAGAVGLVGARWRRMRQDVDVAADLGAARQLGVGPRTSAVLGALAGAPID
jgi:2-phospho-L-lactate guanylyltransferase